MTIFDELNNLMYEVYDCVDWNMIEHCFSNGYWSYEETIDNEGNVLAYYPTITMKDLQEACDDLGLEFDCINY